MIKNAVAHHRYVLIHPFDNGNGRTARLFTYACLLRDGFSLVEKVINPTAVFCSDRNIYYNMLTEADKNSEEGVSNWCKYVLSGLKEEFLKIKKLTDVEFVKNNIIRPTLDFSKMRNAISDKEALILKEFLNESELTTQTLKKVFPEMSKSRYSQIFKEMKGRKLVLETNRAKYVLNFNGPLMRGLINSLNELGFLPVQDESTKNI
jgi:Fic family protein